MDDYNWPNLYRQADKFMRQYIPETMIHTSMRSLFDGRPAVTVHFPAKGHKQGSIAKESLFSLYSRNYCEWSTFGLCQYLFYGRRIKNIWRRGRNPQIK